MNQTAQQIREALLRVRPTDRTNLLRPIADKIDLKDHPYAQDTMAYVDGLGTTGMRELILCIGLFLVEHEIDSFKMAYPEF